MKNNKKNRERFAKFFDDNNRCFRGEYMVLGIYSVRDCKMDLFMRPMYVISTAAAIRSFDDEVNRPAEDNSMYRHPSDYALWEIGSFNEQTGLIDAYDAPKLVIQADQCKRPSGLVAPG